MACDNTCTIHGRAPCEHGARRQAPTLVNARCAPENPVPHASIGDAPGDNPERARLPMPTHLELLPEVFL
eukprot:11163631-Lingulodinium_polyedra.AAC.1